MSFSNCSNNPVNLTAFSSSASHPTSFRKASILLKTEVPTWAIRISLFPVISTQRTVSEKP